MWPLTGGCHYSGGCERFLSGCGACPQIGSSKTADLSSRQWNRKYRAWRHLNITFVALSRWMANYARKSPLALDKPVSVIPNGIDTRTFRPMDKLEARRMWCLPRDRKIVMFGALFGTQDPRKDFGHLSEAYRILAAQGATNDMLGVVFGADQGPRLDIDVRYVGHIRKRDELAALYACADVMVVPSLEENFGKTTLEAMACGIPTVAFANTGQLDIIDHRVNGYLAEDRSAEDLARGILWCLDPDQQAGPLGRNARARVQQNYDIGRIAKEYVALYAQLLRKRRRAPSTVRKDKPETAPTAPDCGPLVAHLPRHGGSTA
jgi:glycosyltransferase involved in cell wall biosynthesis